MHTDLPVPPQTAGRRQWLVHGLSLAATLVTTTYFGGWHYAGFLLHAGPQAPPDQGALAFWLHGLWYSVPVLAILGVHEAGHYLACRAYGVDATPPVYLPAPLPLTGTLGAFIRIRDIIPNRRALFDIGVAGPFAGFVVAIPALVIGLALSRPGPPAPDLDAIVLGHPLVHQAVQYMLWGTLPDGHVLHLHPAARAAWFGLLATALNLFPMAQLDGGHVTYALVGPRARWVTLAGAVALVGLTVLSTAWIAWALLMAVVLTVSGVTHPPTGDDGPGLDRRRRLLALAAAVVFALCFTPLPVDVIEAAAP